MRAISANELSITNFKYIPSSTSISLYLRLINPNLAGSSTPLKLLTYTPNSVSVDSDLSTAKTKIDDYTSGVQTFGIVASHPIADGTVTDLTFTLKVGKSLPLNGYIKVRIPDDFGVVYPFLAAKCKIIDKNAVSKNAQGCVVSDKTITIWNRNDVKFSVGDTCGFAILNQINTPTYNRFIIKNNLIIIFLKYFSF